MVTHEQGSKVLVVEDEPDVRALVRELLERAGYAVREAENGREALRALYAEAPDLVVLDVVLPELDGWSTLQRIREVADVPVLMLSVRDSGIEKVRALRAGADDYVTKPFNRQELVARAEALLRRARKPNGEARRQYADADVTIDFVARAVRAGERMVELTPREYSLLTALVTNAGRALSHDELLELVWGTARGSSPATVRLYVNYLRRKLGPAATRIETVHGFGYRYRLDE